jgi:hypothetical protein
VRASFWATAVKQSSPSWMRSGRLFRPAAAAFAAAISNLRELSTPYHLAHGLLDHTEYLTRDGDAEAAVQAIEEARDIAARLRCQPLLDRAADLTRARSPVQA